jgi:hypothetical protein
MICWLKTIISILFKLELTPCEPTGNPFWFLHRFHEEYELPIEERMERTHVSEEDIVLHGE